MGSNGISYSTVDLNGDNGLGELIAGRKNIPLFRNSSSSRHEKVAATLHEDNLTHWVIGFAGAQYYSYRVGGGAINRTPVMSSLNVTANLTDARGMLKISPDGKKIINTSVGNPNAWLADFDNATGWVSNPIALTNPNSMANSFYGAEFSPDSRLLYLDANTQSGGNGCGGGQSREIIQYEIDGATNWNNNPISLTSSITTNESRGALQLAPDGKIYVARACQPWVGSITNPNIIGQGASYISEAIELAAGTTSREGLPNLPTFYQFEYPNEFSGRLIYDEDGNGCSISDLGFADTRIVAATTTNILNLNADENGNFIYNLPNDSYTITPQPENPSYWNFSPASITVDFPTQASPFTQDFCVTANGSIEDLEVVVVPLEQARPGFETDYAVKIKNKGNQQASGSVTLNFQDEYMTYNTSSPVASIINDELTWQFNNLNPFQTEEFEFTVTMNVPNGTPFPLVGGEVLDFAAVVTGSGTDAMPADNTMTLLQTVVNSFDPNDKTCLEGKQISEFQVGEYVHYMIRFENLGTASAVNIVVKDQIDTTKFDMSTFVPLGGSHDYYVRTVGDGNTVEFIHENIFLDFNDAANDGYVLFKIKTLPTLVDGDTFSNDAEIFFDFNAPIVTNNETTTVNNILSNQEVEDRTVKLYPNPTNGVVNISASGGIKAVAVIDLQGRLLSRTDFISRDLTQTVDLSANGSGVYFLKVESVKGTSVQKVVVE